VNMREHQNPRYTTSISQRCALRIQCELEIFALKIAAVFVNTINLCLLFGLSNVANLSHVRRLSTLAILCFDGERANSSSWNYYEIDEWQETII